MTDSDAGLRALFVARLAAAPPPSEALFDATMERVAAPPRRDARVVAAVAAAQRWLTMPRAALAAAVLAFGIVALLLQPHRTNDVVAVRDAANGPVALDAASRPAAPDAPAPAPPSVNAPKLKVTPNAAAGRSSVAEPAGAVAQIAQTKRSEQIARAGSIGVLVRDVPAALESLNAIVLRADGTIAKLDDTLPTQPENLRAAAVTVVVPTDRFDRTMREIGALGALQARSKSAEAIGDAIVDSQARLRNFHREESDLLRIMDRSGKVGDILDVETKLAEVRGEIEQLDAQLARMHHRVATATLDVTLTQERIAPPAAVPSFGSRVEAIWHAALRGSAAFGLAIVALGLWSMALAPYALVAALIATLVYLRIRPRF